MAYKEKPINHLAAFLPDNTYNLVAEYLQKYPIALKITKRRNTKLGDYIAPFHSEQHKISINGTLNQYEFLITLLHELAHLETYIQYQNKVAAHGKEWKQIYSQILNQFISKNVFPDDINQALTLHLKSVKHTHCNDPILIKTLKKYNKGGTPLYVSDIGIGNTFKIKDNQKYQVLEKLRTRYKCKELRTGRIYLFPQMYEVNE